MSISNPHELSQKEIIIVMVIVAVLGVIAFLKFSQVHEVAKNSADAATVLKQIYRSQIDFRELNSRFTTRLDSLNLADKQVRFFSIGILEADSTKFLARAVPDSVGKEAGLKPLVIDENGKVIQVQ